MFILLYSVQVWILIFIFQGNVFYFKGNITEYEKEIFKENRLMVSLLNHVQLNALGLQPVPASLQIFPEQF